MLALSLFNPGSWSTSEITIFSGQGYNLYYIRKPQNPHSFCFLPPLHFVFLSLIWGICHMFLKAHVMHVSLGRLRVTQLQAACMTLALLSLHFNVFSSLFSSCSPNSSLPAPAEILQNVLHQHTVPSNTWSWPTFRVVIRKISPRVKGRGRGNFSSMEDWVILFLWDREGLNLTNLLPCHTAAAHLHTMAGQAAQELENKEHLQESSS